VHQGTWEQLKATLTTYNKNGAGVFLTVNETKGGRKLEHLIRIRAIWCEWDGDGPLPDWPLAPHLIVESSPGKFHLYWLVTNCSTNEHARIMDAMTGKWGNDPNAEDAVRVLRVPGFYHQKVDPRKGLTGTPWQVRLRSAEGRDVIAPYTVDQLVTGFQVEEWEAEQQRRNPPKPQEAPHRGRPPRFAINVNEVKAALKCIPADERKVWLKVGMALASTRHDDAFPLWDEWSKTSPKNYNEEDQYSTWEGFSEQKGVDREKMITLGTLFKMAKDNGWDRDSNWTKRLKLEKSGDPKACPANIATVLENTPHYKENLRFNEVGGYVEYGNPQYDEYGRDKAIHRWSDADDVQLTRYLLDEHGMAVTSLSHCTQTVNSFAELNLPYDPIKTWLNQLPQWDEIDRLSSFFEDYCEVERSPYASYCGLSFFVSLVARAYEPGIKADTVLVLQGAEGVKKTSLCQLIGGPWYQAIITSFDNKDLLQAIAHTWLGELAELDSFARAGQARVKALLTTTIDHYRPSYGRNLRSQKRRTIFVGTTNEPAYIVDPHGARRVLPLKVGNIHLEAIAEVLLQVFAEAKKRYQDGEPWWVESEAVQLEATELRETAREVDPWEAIIEEYVRKNPGELKMSDLLGSAGMDIPAERQTRSFSTRAGLILHRMGFEKKRRRISGTSGQFEHYYRRL
jgi:putative DNA primase/helicase